MRRFLFVLLLILIGVGYFRGWFEITSSKSQNNLNIGLSVESDKIEQDANQAQERINDLGKQVKIPMH